MGRIDGVLISHEHGDHYMGMDELFAYRRNSLKDTWRPVPVYLTPEAWNVVSPRFAYLEQMDVIQSHLIEPGKWFTHEEYEVFPFRTEHGAFAKGSVGFVVRAKDRRGSEKSLVYTSDFMDLPEVFPEMTGPDYLIIQSFWLNEPVNNRPHHMSFQRAIHFIELLKPGNGTFLVHIGDADMVPGDPANRNLKKYEPKDPLRPPAGGDPYPIPLNQEQWQQIVDRIVRDRDLPLKVTVACDDMRVSI